MLGVGLGVGHGGPTHAALNLEAGGRRLGVVGLAVARRLLQLGLLLRVLHLGLDFLVTASHISCGSFYFLILGTRRSLHSDSQSGRWASIETLVFNNLKDEN